jgi:hypothetical protein
MIQEWAESAESLARKNLSLSSQCTSLNSRTLVEKWELIKTARFSTLSPKVCLVSGGLWTNARRIMAVCGPFQAAID